MKGICGGKQQWDIAKENFSSFRTLPEIFPDDIKHCPGDPGFEIPKKMAPPHYCIRGGNSVTCKPPRCVRTQSEFVKWNNSKAKGFGPWFNEFVRGHTPWCLSVLMRICLLALIPRHFYICPGFGKRDASPLDDNNMELFASDYDSSVAFDALQKQVRPSTLALYFNAHIHHACMHPACACE